MVNLQSAGLMDNCEKTRQDMQPKLKKDEESHTVGRSERGKERQRALTCLSACDREEGREADCVCVTVS